MHQLLNQIAGLLKQSRRSDRRLADEKLVQIAATATTRALTLQPDTTAE